MPSLQLPRLGEGVEAAVVGALDFGRKAASGQLLVTQVTRQTFAANSVFFTAVGGACAPLHVLFLVVTFHEIVLNQKNLSLYLRRTDQLYVLSPHFPTNSPSSPLEA